MLVQLTSKSVLVAFLGLLMLGAPVAHALTIAPARMELTGDPGTVITGEFVVTNEEEGSHTFYTTTQNFEARGETGTPNFTNGDTGLASWVSVAPEVNLGQGEKITIPYTVTVPADAEAGGHFAAIFLSTIPPGNAQVSIGAKIGVLLLLRVSGDVPEEGGISDFTSANGKLFTSLPLAFSYRFTNGGGDRVNPRGDIVVRNIFWLKKTTLPANPGEGNVLPGSTRKFESFWGDSSVARPAGFFGAVAHEWNNFAFGPYSAKLSLAYGVDGKATESAWVFLFPWHLLLVIGAILLLVLPIVLLGIRRYNRWIIEKARQTL